MICRNFKFICPLLSAFLLIISGICPGLVRAAETPGLFITPDLQFSYADKLYREGDYTASQVEFKRFIHFFPDDSRGEEAQFKVAAALYNSGDFYEAAQTFNQIILQDKEETGFTRESYFMQSKAFLAMDNPGYAQVVLQNYLKLTDNPATKDRIYLELARIHIRETRNLGTDNLDQAEKYLKLVSPDRKQSGHVAAQLEAIEQVRAAPRKNPTLSGILAVIPGGGFLYCERYKDAFVTFCLNAGLIYGAYEAFNNDNPALGGVVAFVGTGFYTGNIYGSVTAAHKYNKSRQVQILNREFNLDARIDPVNSSYLFTLNHAF